MSRIEGEKQMHATRKTMAKGFTLVEILIVVVILGILAAIVVPQFTNAANEARQGNVETQTSTLENQIELYAAQNNGIYPTVAQLNANPANGSTSGWSVMIDGNYIKEAPANPFSAAATRTLVTVSAAANSTAADAEANLGDGTQGWYYNPVLGIIRASGGNY
jgi:general secretion pathway protein G